MLPSKDQQYLNSRGISFEAKTDGAKKGIILKDFLLPKGKFDSSKADVLILLPSGYPDARPECFYTFPRIKLSQTRKDPRATSGNFPFNQRQWQFWSRHSREWRPGIDGIWTMIKRVQHALEVAQGQK